IGQRFAHKFVQLVFVDAELGWIHISGMHAQLRASYLAAGSVVERKRLSGPRPLCKSGTLSLVYHKRLMIDGMTSGRELKQSNLNIRLSYIVSRLRCRRSPEVQESFRSCSDLRSRVATAIALYD